MEYQFTKEMREISGFGGGYEDCCRRMILSHVDLIDTLLNNENFNQQK